MVMGLNVTLIVQLVLAASVLPHVVVFEKSTAFVPVIVMLDIVRVALPVFVSVMACPLLLVPIIWLLKLRLVGEKPTLATLSRYAPSVGGLVCVPVVTLPGHVLPGTMPTL